MKYSYTVSYYVGTPLYFPYIKLKVVFKTIFPSFRSLPFLSAPHGMQPLKYFSEDGSDDLNYGCILQAKQRQGELLSLAICLPPLVIHRVRKTQRIRRPVLLINQMQESLKVEILFWS
jgi:hypothetical protein